MLAMLVMCFATEAEEVPGITVDYVNIGTSAYVQAISAIGKIKFEVKEESKHALIEFKDKNLADVDLGAVSDINRISFGTVSEKDIPTFIKEIEVSNELKINVTVYPNPTADHLHVSGVSEGATIRLFSTDGKLVLSSKEKDLNLSGMPNGMYILQVDKEIVKIIKK